VILLLYCNRVPPAANTRTAKAATGFECRRHAADQSAGMRKVADGGPRSTADPTVHSEIRTVGDRRMYRPALAGRYASIRGPRVEACDVVVP
jgi:hypothetical protein